MCGRAGSDATAGDIVRMRWRDQQRFPAWICIHRRFTNGRDRTPQWVLSLDGSTGNGRVHHRHNHDSKDAGMHNDTAILYCGRGSCSGIPQFTALALGKYRRRSLIGSAHGRLGRLGIAGRKRCQVPICHRNYGAFRILGN